MLDNGDCTVIKTPKGKIIMVDTGEQDNTVVKYLLDRGIRKIDYLMISHFDTDHCGKTIEVLERLKVKNIIISKQAEASKEFEDIMQKIRDKKVNIIQVQAGDRLQVDKDVYFYIVWPQNEEIVSDMNNNSIVAKMYYHDFSMLFTGDVEEETEQKIAKKYSDEILKSTVLKVAHHGSNTSSTKILVERIKSKIALIGVGENNKFGHPSDTVLELLKSQGNIIYRTDLCGEITLKINKNGAVKVSTQIFKRDMYN